MKEVIDIVSMIDEYYKALSIMYLKGGLGGMKEYIIKRRTETKTDIYKTLALCIALLEKEKDCKVYGETEIAKYMNKQYVDIYSNVEFEGEELNTFENLIDRYIKIDFIKHFEYTY